MNDLDAQVEELGGDRTFFTAEFEKYRWNNLISPRLGGFEVLNLYVKGKTTLTPDERTTLAENISGYDISPDMVRLFLKKIFALFDTIFNHLYKGV